MEEVLTLIREAIEFHLEGMTQDGEPKRRANLRKHGIDLAELESAFDFPMITVEDDREHYGELRLQTLGMWRGQVVFLVWTARGDDDAHLIFSRYANRTQVEEYFSAL